MIALSNSALCVRGQGSLKCWQDKVDLEDTLVRVGPERLGWFANSRRTDLVQIVSASDSNFGVLGNGKLLCWGANEKGQHGFLPLGQSTKPVTVEGLPPAP